MKKIVLFAISLFGVAQLSAQELNVNEALLFAQENLTGTARYQSMSGAFGALGGDFTALSVNPAGSTVFANNKLGFSLVNTTIKNTSSFFGSNFETAKNTLRINQLAGVFVFKDTTKSNNFKKLSIAMTYDSSNRFNNDVLAVGTNPNASIGNYFAAITNGSGIKLEDVELIGNETYTDRYRYFGDNFGYNGQLTFLGYNSYLISPLSSNLNETNFVSNAASNKSYTQEMNISSFGESGKVSANVATEFKDVLSIGLNLNNHFVTSNRSYKFIEKNSNTTSNGFNYAELDTNIATIGSGFSFNLGLLAKINQVRLGIAYQSSTWYTFTEEVSHQIRYKAVDGADKVSGAIDPNTINTYPSYQFQSPGKATLSAAYVFGKKGLISMDYNITNYSNIKYKPDGDSSYRKINVAIQNDLKSFAQDIRIGGEYRLNQFSLRGGANFRESPYDSGVGVGNYYQVSAGGGYSFGRATVDVSYTRAFQAFENQLYSTGLTDKYQTYSHTSTIVCSLLFEL